MELNFTRKIVLITGASAGIGEATSLLFAKLGAKLALVGRNELNLQSVAERCEKERGLKPLQIVADLATDEGVEKTAKETIEHFGRLDVLVNNAGITTRTSIERADLKSFDEVFNVNVRSVYNLTRLLVPNLISSKGNIINVSSISATRTIVGNLPYAMTKAALDQFTRGVALELAPKGVRVNTVSPGITRTKIHLRIKDYSEEEYQAWLDKAAAVIPMRKICESVDIAKMIAFIASDHSGHVTGTVIQIDGGANLGSPGSLMAEQMYK